MLQFDWDMVIAHPPCTYLTNSGVRWLHAAPKKPKPGNLYGEARWNALKEAIEFFRLFQNLPHIPQVVIENPIPHNYARDGFVHPFTGEVVSGIGWYDQVIQPWQYGEGETKATCLWRKGLPELQPTRIISGRNPTVHYMILHMKAGTTRSHERSRTYQGIAEAIAYQYGGQVYED